ncbi:MAG TPA: ABC transporter permease subunit/CPBP intramembrane protease [Gemmataceae bacterium]|nr:ABC transporter permease subunit/CPBP intramembrane protease [Gemmataceae bacterium]
MRFAIIRLIWFRELRDQFRDRRTVFMVLVLPMLLYPILGLVLVRFALGFMEQPTTIGIQGMGNLPALEATSAGLSPLPALAWLGVYPGAAPTVSPVAAAGLYQAVQSTLTDPPLVIGTTDNNWQFPSAYFDDPALAAMLPVRPVSPEYGQADLAAKAIDLLLIVPADCRERLTRGERVVIEIRSRPGDDASQLAERRATAVLNNWKQAVTEARLRRRGLPTDFQEPIAFVNWARAKPALVLASEGLRDQLIRLIPFLLVVWSLAGALYPAVDVCAGEKERGTMETLLISPASREEIVFGKFLTIWLFSSLATVWNLICMGVTACALGNRLPQWPLAPAAVVWCMVLILPLTAFFSAVCLAMGVYARSSKEGQYYLMPLFLATMPLVFLTLAPGVQLNAFYSLLPVTGVALLMQRLMVDPTQVPWLYAVPVLAAVVLYSLLALRWAIEQFKREEVLFREAERLDLGLWLRRLVRERRDMPSVGQALVCFAIVLVERWLLLGMGADQLTAPGVAVAYLALFSVPLFMAILLADRPWRRLGLDGARLDDLLKAALFAVMLLPPLVEIARAVHEHFEGLEQLFTEQQSLAWTSLWLSQEGGNGPEASWPVALLLALAAGFCEEVVFRGYVLNGLRHYLSPRSAVLFSSFLFALYDTNAFRFVPAFAAGVILGLITIRSGNIWSAVLVHFLASVQPVLMPLLERLGYWNHGSVWNTVVRPGLVLVCSLAAAALLLRLSRPTRKQERPRRHSIGFSSTDIPKPAEAKP